MKLIKNNQSFMVILPKQLVLAKQWKHGDPIVASIDKEGNITLKKKDG